MKKSILIAAVVLLAASCGQKPGNVAGKVESQLWAPVAGVNVSVVGGTAKAIDLNEVPQLDPNDVRGLSEIVEDLEKLLAELKNDSTEKQIDATKERIKNLKSKLDTQFKERLDKIDETMQKLDEIEAEELSDADYFYYVEVTARIEQKLLKAL